MVDGITVGYVAGISNRMGDIVLAPQFRKGITQSATMVYPPVNDLARYLVEARRMRMRNIRFTTALRLEGRQLLNRFRPWRAFANEKFVCIGMVKTGTSSLGAAMRGLGFRHVTYNPYVYGQWFRRGRLDKVLYHSLSYDSFDDLPYSNLQLMEMIREWYPNAKFILLQRDTESWVSSLRAHAMRAGHEVTASDQRLEELYRSRQRYVEAWIARHDLETRVLRMNIIAGDGYPKLCPFVGRPVKHELFPRVNVRPDRAEIVVSPPKSDCVVEDVVARADARCCFKSDVDRVTLRERSSH